MKLKLLKGKFTTNEGNAESLLIQLTNLTKKNINLTSIIIFILHQKKQRNIFSSSTHISKTSTVTAFFFFIPKHEKTKRT